MLNHTFTFNGHSSDEFGIKIERFRALNRPARKFDAASVPGRNGNIYKLQDAYEEVLVSYQIWAKEDGTLEGKWTNIMVWLNSADGYAELRDTYDTTHYREAVFVDATDIENSWNTFGRAIVNFRCRPERFLVSNAQIRIPGNLVETTINNPTNHIAKPLISISRATTPGAYITVNGVTITLSEAFANDCYIDCETEDIYGTAGNNMNSIATVTKNGIVTPDFLKLVPGANTIVISSANGGWIVEPRIWEL